MTVAHPLSGQLEWRRGWRVVAATTVGVGTGAGLYQYVGSLFVEPLEAAFGWTRGEIGTGAAIGLLGAMGAPLIGRLADRHGVRRVAVTCIVTLALAHLWLASMTGAFWQFVVGALVIGAVAPGCTGLVYSRAVNGWFDRSRGLALGVMAAGLSIATLLLSPGIAWLIDEHGFRAGYLALAGIALLIGLPVVLIGVREAPHDLVVPGIGKAGHERFGIIWRSRVFWLLAAIMFLVNVPAAGVLTQLVPLLTAKGFSSAAASGFLALFAAAVLTGRIGVGWLFDRLDARWVAATVTLAAAAGALMLLSGVPIAAGIAGLVLLGFLQGAETDVLAYFVARQFARVHYGAIYGTLFAISLLGTAAGFILFGQLFTATGAYDAPLVVSAAILVVAGLLYLAVSAFPRGEAVLKDLSERP